ncbi:phosphoglycerate mutase family protein [Mollisia scopiformis]|uniref:Phosphoglycerate mutase family protein n=1 Tax=Mollisia scopiformis TaxID=149040 RepID=A0A194WVJ5_MOLSC|nr:phosphoglycerate mutase family protein [Mollisia scopiformis]KUJ11981.1 phosphoglycerate mutase family protein [Mollisia scopiformis]
MGEAPKPEEEYLKFTTVTGYFQQDDPATNPKAFDYATTNFGLINRAYDTDANFDPEGTKTQWQKFDHHVTQINHESDSNTQYKVLYMGRHGQGYHNAAESYYGTEAWDCYWSLQDGNETSTWADALLTDIGIAEAKKANKFWQSLISDQKISTPQSYYTSPLLRCMQTAEHTFTGLTLPADRPFIPMIKELVREVIGVHTCDRRSTKTVIHGKYPNWPFEEGFAEEDELWSATLRETAEAQDQRTKVVLDDIFSNDENTHISISSHSGEISSILRVLGHRAFALSTGQMIPVLVKIEKVKGTLPPVVKAPWDKPKTCEKPPAML